MIKSVFFQKAKRNQINFSSFLTLCSNCTKFFGFQQHSAEEKRRVDVYKRQPLTLEQWRVQNINALVSGIYGAVKSIDQSVVFGIAPQGNMENCKNMYADIQTWGSTNGYVDYLCPQMYFTFDNPYQPYGDVAKAWRDMVTLPTVRLYAGLAVYKAGSDEYDNGLWGKADDILKREMEYAQSNGFDGAFLYSYDYLRTEQTSKEMENIEDLLT